MLSLLCVLHLQASAPAGYVEEEEKYPAKAVCSSSQQSAPSQTSAKCCEEQEVENKKALLAGQKCAREVMLAPLVRRKRDYNKENVVCQGCLPRIRCPRFKALHKEEGENVLRNDESYREYKRTVYNGYSYIPSQEPAWADRYNHYKDWFYKTSSGSIVHGASKIEGTRDSYEPRPWPLSHDVFPMSDKEAWHFLAHQHYYNSTSREFVPQQANTLLKKLEQKSIEQVSLDDATPVWLIEQLESHKNGDAYHSLLQAITKKREREHQDSVRRNVFQYSNQKSLPAPTFFFSACLLAHPRRHLVTFDSQKPSVWKVEKHGKKIHTFVPQTKSLTGSTMEQVMAKAQLQKKQASSCV